MVGNGTRLVFEIQSTATGQYVSGLTAELEVRAPMAPALPLPEITGVTAYYETTLAFEQEGEYADLALCSCWCPIWHDVPQGCQPQHPAR